MKLRAVFSAASIAPALIAAALGLVCVMNPHRPLPYLIDIFSVPGLTFALVLAAALWAMRQQPAQWIAAGAVLIFLLATWPQAFPLQAAADRNSAPVRLVFANLLIRNEHPEKILPWIAKENPDIVALVEVNPFARDALIESLKSDRPYIVTRYDMVIASRFPLTDTRRGADGLSLLTTDVRAPGGDFVLAVAHLTRPWPFKPAQDQRGQFDRLDSTFAGLADHRFVLAGDFNTPPCASGLGDFLRARRLHAAPALFGTWPSLLPGLLRVTIDNAMASKDLNLSRRAAGPFDGSDHRPIVVDIRPAKI